MAGSGRRVDIIVLVDCFVLINGVQFYPKYSKPQNVFVCRRHLVDVVVVVVMP